MKTKNMEDKLILVNERDQIVGVAPKTDCHLGKGMRHRAFSIFIFNRQGQLLIQKRSANKMLWPTYWANSCCSHPRVGEDTDRAADRRLLEELGLKGKLKKIFSFRYHVSFRRIGSENEICSVYVGRLQGKPKVNPEEISDWKYADLKLLYKEVKKNPKLYAPWFKIELKKLRKIKFNPDKI